MTLPLKKLVFFKVLLNRFHPTSGEAALKHLPQAEAKEIFKQTVSTSDTAPVIALAEQIIARTHYSWLAPIIQKMPKALQGATVAALPEPQSTKLMSFLRVKPPSSSLALSVKKFLLNQFYLHWKPSDILPVAYLPPTSLQFLLDYKKNGLVKLIDFLALYDLAEAVRHIVDRKYLKRIYIHLGDDEQRFLRQCLHNHEKITVSKLNIVKWDGHAESLKAMLHKRGLFRLGKALCGQPSLFMWHLVHILDTGRGTTLMSYYKEAETPGITPILVQQILTVTDFLKSKSEAS